MRDTEFRGGKVLPSVPRGEAVTPEDPEVDVYLDRGFRRGSYHRPPNLMAGAAYLLVGFEALLSSAAAILASICGFVKADAISHEN